MSGWLEEMSPEREAAQWTGSGGGGSKSERHPEKRQSCIEERNQVNRKLCKADRVPGTKAGKRRVVHEI